jgi:hypothetical protein
MTEEQIERAVERSMDALDRRFMEARSGFTQAAYDAQVKAIDNWAREQRLYGARLAPDPSRR